jgi:hypothetical protein
MISTNLVGLNREVSDAFYTNTEVANKLILNLKSKFKFEKFDYIVEPSAGAGAFSDYFHDNKSLRNKLCAYDINPQKNYIKKQDFLKLNISKFSNKKILTIGNPPFGRQSSLVKQFIKKCCLFSTIVAFILPKSFKKDSYKNTFPLNFHLISSLKLKENAFIINGNPYNVPCIFQVWQKKDTNRKVPKYNESLYFEFVKKSSNPDFSIRRIGVNAGRISNKIEEKSETSHYFIKLKKNITRKKFMNIYIKVNFPFDNTVGPKSISKSELINAVNSITP